MSPKKVMIIDDSDGILFAVKSALTLKGYDVYTAETFEGVSAVVTVAPDLLYLDVSLVGKDGRLVARELKGDVQTKYIPIVMLTAYPNASELAKEAGAEDFLAKPFELEDLWNMTEKHTATLFKKGTM